MNLSTLLTKIKIACGIYTIALPFENCDAMLTDIITKITLPTFSVFSPCYEKFRFSLSSLEELEKNANYEVYLLPDIFSQRQLLFIKDISYDEADISGLGYWGSGVPILNGSMIRQSILSGAGMNLTNRMIPKITFKYEHPRKVTLYNVLSSCNLVFELALSHDINLASIPPTSEESFYELALLDVKKSLYETMKHSADISSAYGNITLKLEEWAQAESARETLINEWKGTYHMDVLPFQYA